MAIAFANLGATAGTAEVDPDIGIDADQSSYVSASWTPPTTGIILLYILNGHASSATDVVSVTGNGITWEKITTVLFSGTTRRLSLWAAKAAGATTGATTISFGATVQIGCTVSFFQATGCDESGTLQAIFVQKPSATGTSGTTGTVTQAAVGNANNRPISGFAHLANEASTARANWTLQDYMHGAGPVRALISQSRESAWETVATATWGASSAWAGIAAELKAAVVTPQYGAVSLPITFSKDVQGRRTTFGQVAAPFIFSKDVQGRRKAFGQIVAPFTFGASIDGIGTAPPPYQAAILADGPAAYWRMDEASGFPRDSSPSGYHMTGTGGTGTLTPGSPGLILNEPESDALAFAGITALNRSGILFPYNTFSVEVWVKRTRTNVTENLCAQYNGGLELAIMADGTLRLRESFGDGNVASSSTLKILDTNPHHIVVTRNGIGGPVVFYLDKVSETVTSSSADLSSAATNGFFIGSEWGTAPFEGILDELAVYPHVLTPAQVQNHYDIAASPIVTTVYGSLAFPMTFGKEVQGRRTTFGQVVLPVIFSKNVLGQRKTFGQIVAPFTFGKAVAGRKTTFGKIDFPINVFISVAGDVQTRIFGSFSMPITFGKDVRGQRKTFGQIAFPIIFTKDVRGQRKVFGQIAFPIVFTKDVRGQRKTFSQVAFPIVFTKDVRGQRKVFGQTALPIIFTKDVRGRKQTYGVITRPFTFGAIVQGRSRTYGAMSLPIIFASSIGGKAIPDAIILNHAVAVYLGETPVIAIYTDDQQVF